MRRKTADSTHSVLLAAGNAPTFPPYLSSFLPSLPPPANRRRVRAHPKFGTAPVWTRTQDLYKTKVAESKE